VIGDPIVIGASGPISWTPPVSSMGAPGAGTSGLIFPVLSKAPQINAVLKYDEAGTLIDGMESGAVATRPRFTRNRRTWSVSYRGLTLVDLAVLDFFVRQQAVLGANGFWFPNQLANGGMDLGADLGSGDVVRGWAQGSAQGGLVWVNTQEQNPANTLDGGNAMLLSFKAGQSVPVGAFGEAVIGHRSNALPYLPIPGETYLAAGRFLVSNTLAFPANIQPSLVITLTINYDDGSQDVFNSASINSNANSQGWQELTVLGTVGAGKNVVSMTFTINHGVINSSSSTWNMPGSGNCFDVRADQCGIALVASPRPYGALAGATGISSLVRFSKAPQAAQAGRADLVTTAFEITEM